MRNVGSIQTFSNKQCRLPVFEIFNPIVKSLCGADFVFHTLIVSTKLNTPQLKRSYSVLKHPQKKFPIFPFFNIGYFQIIQQWRGFKIPYIPLFSIGGILFLSLFAKTYPQRKQPYFVILTKQG